MATEAVTVFDCTLLFALRGLGVRRLDVRFKYFGDHGANAPSNSILISTEIAERRPLVGAALLRAIIRGWVKAVRARQRRILRRANP